MAVKRTAKSCGRDAPTLAFKLAMIGDVGPSGPTRRIHAGDGDNKARSPGRSRRKPLKPLRAGMPGDPGATVVTNARVYYTPRAAAGALGTRHSPRPLISGAIVLRIARAPCAAGMRMCVSASLRGAKATKQSILS